MGLDFHSFSSYLIFTHMLLWWEWMFNKGSILLTLLRLFCNLACDLSRKKDQVHLREMCVLKWNILYTFFKSICYVSMSVAQTCLTRCDPMDCSPSGCSVHGILQARILEWVRIPFSRGNSWPRDWTWVSHTAGRFFTIWATGKPYIVMPEDNHTIWWN